MLITRNLHMKSSEVSIKARSTPASLSFKGQATKHTTIKWSIQKHSTVLNKFGLSDTNHQRGRQTRSNRSNEKKTDPETMKPQPRLMCYLQHNFFFSLSILSSHSKLYFPVYLVQCQHSHALFDAHVHPTANVT